MLEDLGQHLARGGDRDARQLLFQDLAHPVLVGGIRIGVDEADRDCCHATTPQKGCDPARLLFVQGLDNVSCVVDALRDFETVPALDVRRSHVLVSIPEIRLRASPDLDHVPEATRRHHRCRREPPRNERVRGDGRAVREEDDIVKVDTRSGYARQHPLHRISC